MDDLTVIYYTADFIPPKFAWIVQNQILTAIGNTNIIQLHQPKDLPRNHLQIYKNALEGAKRATTKYIALCEDDVLYHSDHFKFRPKDGHFGYNMNVWSIFTWVKPAIFNYKGRINLSGLICERDLFIEAMEERFAKFPDESKINLGHWGEPGKYEGPNHLGVTERKIEMFNSDMPNVAFSHETALSYENLGNRKKMGQPRALEIPYWGKAEEVIKFYED